MNLIQVEIKEVVDIGYLNGLFVLARSIGLIGVSTSWQRANATAKLCAALQSSVRSFNSVEALTRDDCCAGHALDQKRLQQPLYRHPWDDVRTTKPSRSLLCL